jgi:hypothetical protein
MAPDIFPSEVKSDKFGVHVTCTLSPNDKLFLGSDIGAKGNNDGHHSYYTGDWLVTHKPFGEDAKPYE